MKHYKLAKENSDLSLLLIPVLTSHVELIFCKENCAEAKSECLKAFLTPLYTSALYGRNILYYKPN